MKTLALETFFLGHTAHGADAVQRLLRHLLTQLGVAVRDHTVSEVHVASPSILMRSSFFRQWLPAAVGARDPLLAPGDDLEIHLAMPDNYRFGACGLITGEDQVNARLASSGLTLKRGSSISPWLIVLSELYAALSDRGARSSSGNLTIQTGM